MSLQIKIKKEYKQEAEKESKDENDFSEKA